AANGKILRSGLFSRLFVQPASHDAGCSLGAALALHHQGAGMPVERLEHVYWGRHIGSDEELAERLAGWAPVVTAERPADVCGRTARSSAGRRAAPSSGRARSATAASWPTRARSATASESTP